MARIPRFKLRWAYFKTRASQIVPQHFPEGKEITYDSVARWIPHDPSAPFPAVSDSAELDFQERPFRGSESKGPKVSPTSPITGAAFGLWIDRERIPTGRENHFVRLTGVAIGDWTAEQDAWFERAVRRAAQEVLNWNGLVTARATPGGLRVHVADPGTAMKLLPPGAVFAAESPRVTLCWPTCIARIELPPALSATEHDDRRAWMLADYEQGDIFLLDPSRTPDSPVHSTRLGRTVWLPRGHPGYCSLPPTTPLRTRFDVLVLILNLESQPDEIRAQFDGLEQQLPTDVSAIWSQGYQRTLRQRLDEAATLIDDHDIRVSLYRQTCEVTDRRTALGMPLG